MLNSHIVSGQSQFDYALASKLRVFSNIHKFTEEDPAIIAIILDEDQKKNRK